VAGGQLAAGGGAEGLSWGDSRIGNMLFVDFEPSAVLDWEMVATGPREIDLGWMTYIHHFFQDFTPLVGLPAPRHDATRHDVRSLCRATGYRPRDMEFYTFYSALRHGIVMFRIGRRQALFARERDPENSRRHDPAPPRDRGDDGGQLLGHAPLSAGEAQ